MSNISNNNQTEYLPLEKMIQELEKLICEFKEQNKPLENKTDMYFKKKNEKEKYEITHISQDKTIQKTIEIINGAKALNSIKDNNELQITIFTNNLEGETIKFESSEKLSQSTNEIVSNNIDLNDINCLDTKIIKT